MSLDWSTLRALARLTDDVGVLSLYVTADPREEGAQPAWQVRARNELKRLVDQANEDGPRDRSAAVRSRLDALSDHIDHVLDPRTPGLGRALFAAVDGGEVYVVTLQVPLTDRAVLRPTPLLRPLLGAWSAAGPAGAVAVSIEEIRLVDLRFGLAEEIATIEYPEDVGDRRRLKGPAHGSPATTYHAGAPQQDLFERREEDRAIRYLRSLGPQINDHVRERGWELLAVTGEAKLSHALSEELSPGSGAEVVTLTRTVTPPTPTRIAATVESALADSRTKRNRRLAEEARDAGLSASATTGAAGLEPTLEALQQGRVAHLLFAADGQWTGRRMPDGSLIVGGTAAGSEPEPHLDERMIALALREGAAITVLDGDAAEPFAQTEKIGAVLRW